jgi:sugar (pentulose or hexulose) kinase
VTIALLGLDVGTTGAAPLGGVACGTFADAHEAVAACVRVSDRIEPDPDLRAFYADRYRVYRTVYPTLKEIR